MAPELDDIRGVEAFRLGHEIDPAGLGVHALDDLTLEVELETPISHFPYLLTKLPFYPVPGHTVARYGDAWTQPQHLVTNGPFRLENWNPGASMTVTLDPTYDGPIYGNVRQVRMLFVRNAKTELEMYEAGDLDAVELSGYSIPELDRLRWRHAEEYLPLVDMDVAILAFDVAHPPFDDPRVRRAFAHAVNIEFLSNEILHGYEPPATGGLIPQGVAGHSPGLVLPYEPTLARECLAQAGFAGGRGFPLVELLLPGAEGAPSSDSSLRFQHGHRRLPGQSMAGNAERRNKRSIGVFRGVSQATIQITSADQIIAVGGRLSGPGQLAEWDPPVQPVAAPRLRTTGCECKDRTETTGTIGASPGSAQATPGRGGDCAPRLPAKHWLFKPWYRLNQTWAQWYWQDFVLIPH